MAHSRETLPDMFDTPSKRKEPSEATSYNGFDEGEPSLPSTPSQLGIEPPLPKPRGLLFQSPGKNSGRKVTSSPLKYNIQDTTNTSLGTRINVETTPKSLEPCSLAQLESRLQILQRELTIETLETAWSTDNKADQKLSQKHKLVSKDAREILNLRHANRHLYKSIVKDPQRQMQSTHQRLANFMPFSNSLNHTSASRVLLTANVIQSFVDRSNFENLLIFQDINILDTRGQLVATMHISVDPISQIATNRVRHSHVELQGNSELQSWLDWPGTDRPLATIGKVIERYGMISSLRDQCWVSCKEELGMLVENELDQSRNGIERGESYVQWIQFCAQSSLRLAFSWRILIDEDGDVRSEVRPSLTFPDTWAEHDRNHDLSRVEEIFASLLRDQGVTQAIITLTRTMISHSQQGASSEID